MKHHLFPFPIVEKRQHFQFLDRRFPSDWKYTCEADYFRLSNLLKILFEKPFQPFSGRKKKESKSQNWLC